MLDYKRSQLLSLVVPFYNEGEALESFFARVVPILESIAFT